jgi:DNA-binding LytR/AlgR family response regulator
MITALIADDESLLRDELRDQLRAVWPALDIVAEATNGNEAAKLIAKLEPDVAFLDIKMPGLTGIEVAQGIDGETRVVFVTAYDQYAVEAFDNEAIDYLLKPISKERLAKAVARLKAAIEQKTPAPDIANVLNLLSRAHTKTGMPPTHLKWIRASRGDTTYQIAVDDVLFFQSDDKYTVVNTESGEHLIRMALAELLQSLDPENFWQVHRGTVVNIHRVASSKRDGDGRVTLNLRGWEKPVAVSRAYSHLFRQM